MQMKTALLDNNIIDFCRIEKGLSGQDFNKILRNHNYLPIIGQYTIYEQAKCYENKLEVMKSNFIFIQELSPILTCSGDKLFEMEWRHLTELPPINPLIFLAQAHALQNKINNLSMGIVEEDTKNVIATREADLEKNRKKNWVPRGLQQEYKNFHSFEDRKKHVLEMLKLGNQNYRNAIKQLFLPFKLTISEAHLKTFIENLDRYPAWRALLYQHLYLDFLTEKNNTTPARNKLPDGLQVIEASYCSALISGDKDLVTTHAQYLNPDIQTINIRDLIEKS